MFFTSVGCPQYRFTNTSGPFHNETTRLVTCTFHKLKLEIRIERLQIELQEQITNNKFR